MPPTKTQVEPQTKAAPATATAKQPALPEKQGGPARLGLVQRAGASALHRPIASHRRRGPPTCWSAAVQEAPPAGRE